MLLPFDPFLGKYQAGMMNSHQLSNQTSQWNVLLIMKCWFNFCFVQVVLQVWSMMECRADWIMEVSQYHLHGPAQVSNNLIGHDQLISDNKLCF